MKYSDLCKRIEEILDSSTYEEWASSGEDEYAYDRFSKVLAQENLVKFIVEELKVPVEQDKKI
jgi:hypothetical protein